MENIVTAHTSEGKQVGGGLMGLICDILKWTQEEYASFQYESGIKYLEYYIPEDPSAIDQLTRSRMFWAWWRNHWNSRDRAFAGSGAEALPYGERTLIYKGLHDSQVLASEIYPGRVVLDTSYSEMIGRLFDSEIHK